MPKFNVTSPDGRTVEVTAPDGATEQQAIEYAQSHWDALSKGAQVSHEPSLWESAKNAIGAVTEPVAKIATGIIAKPLADVAGLAAIPLHAAGITKYEPGDIQAEVQKQLTYEPTTAAGTSALNPLNAIPAAIGGAVEAVSPAAATDASSAGGMAQNFAREAIAQGVGFIPGGKIVKGAESLAARGVEAGIPGAALAQKIIPASVDATQAKLDLAKSTNLVKDTIRENSKAAGFIVPSEGGVKGTVARMSHEDSILSKKNTENADKLLAEDLGLKKGVPISQDSLSGRKYEAYKAYYNLVKEAPATLAVTPEFKTSIQSAIDAVQAKVDSDPEVFGALKATLPLLKEQLREGKTFTPDMTLGAIKQLRKDASAAYSSADKDPIKLERASASRAVADQLEGLFEANLADKPGVLSEFQSQRMQLAKIGTVERAMNPTTGEINLRKLASMHEKNPKLFTGNIKTVADFASTFPNAAKKVTGQKADIGLFDAAVAGTALAAGHVWLAAGELGSRLAAPAAIKAGLLQKKTPSYRVGKTRRLAGRIASSQALAAGIGQIAADEQLKRNKR